MAPFSIRGRLHNKGITKKCSKLQMKTKKNGMKNVMQERFKRLKTEMEEMNKEQKNIQEGQRQIGEKFEAIKYECEKLKNETKMMIQHSGRTQVKLALMFRILKAREEGDFAIAANLTQLLRQIVTGWGEEGS